MAIVLNIHAIYRHRLRRDLANGAAILLRPFSVNTLISLPSHLCKKRLCWPMVSRAEGAHELTDFTLLCISCSAICSSDDRVESVKKVLDEQKCALFTCLAIRQQSPEGPLWVGYHGHRTVTRLDGLWKLTIVVRRCMQPECPRYHVAYRPEEEGGWALPHGEFGLEVIALIGGFRFREHRSVPEMHRALLARG